MELTPQEFLTLISSFGASGVLAMWLRWVIGRLDAAEKTIERTQQKLEDALKDCNRDNDTRRIIQPSPAEAAAYKRQHLGDE